MILYIKNEKNMKDKFQINKAYYIKYVTKQNYKREYIWLCLLVTEKIAKFKTINLWETEIELNWEENDLEFSEVHIAEFTEKYVRMLEENIKDKEESLINAKKLLREWEIFINNRSFLWKIKNFLLYYPNI